MARPWEWQATTYDYISKSEARDRLEAEMIRAATSGTQALIDGLMGMGKTYTTGRLAALSDTHVIALSRKLSTRAQIKERAKEAGLSVHELGVFNRDCPTARGKHGEEWQSLVLGLQGRRVTASHIHKYLDEIPCQNGGRCPYTAKCDFDSKEYEVLIGHPVHAYVEGYIERRVVVFDEDSGSAFEESISHESLQSALNVFLKDGQQIPARHLDQLRQRRQRDELRSSVESAAEGLGTNSPEYALDSRDGRSDIGVLLAGVTLGSDVGWDTEVGPIDLERYVFERDDKPDITTVYDSERAALCVRRPPDLQRANAVLALDGTPTKAVWDGRLGVDLTHVPVLDTEERHEYISDALGYTIYQTTTDAKPVTSGNWADREELEALVQSVYRRHGKPHVISSKHVTENGYIPPGKAHQRPSANHDLYYGNIRSENTLSEEDLLVVYGSHHPGDRTIQRLAALDGWAIQGEGKGPSKTYGTIGDRYYRHAVHNEVAQAIFRVGRNAEVDGATIYVHTSLFPEWVPVKQLVGLRSRREKEKAAIQHIQEAEVTTTANIAEAAETGKRNVQKILRRLRDEGVVESEGKGPSRSHISTGLEGVHMSYEVDFSEADTDTLNRNKGLHPRESVELD